MCGNYIQVRVGNLQELVYKQGQAGVTKATVTIVFDNSDSSNSPVGYEHLKQITVSRQVCIAIYFFIELY
jgi:structural maintenance of chromosome 2